MSITNPQTMRQLGCELWWPGEKATANSPKAVTASGNATQILPFAGAGIGMFDGNGDYLSVNTNNTIAFGYGDFTIEAYVLFTGFTSEMCILLKCAAWASQLDFALYTNSSHNVSFVACNGGTIGITSSIALSLNTKYYIAIIRRAGITTMYINGISVGSSSASGSIGNTTNTLSIGSWNGTSAFFKGTISEVRISNIAYNINNSNLQFRQLESNEHTKLLLHFQANNNIFVDSSSSPKTIIPYGNAKQLCSPCGSGVAYFDGTEDYLSIADSSILELGAGNWTIQGRIYLSTVGRRNGIICKNDTTARYPALMLEVNASNRLALTMSSNGSSNDIANAVEGTTTTFAANTWYDIKIVRTGTSIIVYVNGTAEISITSSATPVDSSYAWGIGCVATDGTGSLLGYISEFEYASTTRPLTIATQPFAPDPYTKLLLHMDGTGNAFYDSSDPPGDNGFPILPDGVTVTPYGTFTTQKLKNGSNVLKFDGSTNYVSIADHAAWTVGAYNFTICLWAKFDAVDALRTLLHLFAATNSGIEIYLSASAKLCLKVSDTSTAGNMVNITGSATIVAATWYHIAVVRNGSVFTVYLNLVSDSTGSSAATVINPTAVALGCRPSGTPDQFMIGNIKDAQIFNGVALSVDQIGALMDETFIY